MVSAMTYGDLGAVGPERTGSWEGGAGGFGLEHATRSEADASIATKERDELFGFIDRPRRMGESPYRQKIEVGILQFTLRTVQWSPACAILF